MTTNIPSGTSRAREPNNWKQFEKPLLDMSVKMKVLRGIIEQEINKFGGNQRQGLHRLYEESGISAARIRDFVSHRSAFTGETSLNKLVAYAGKRHLTLENVVNDVLKLKASLPIGLGPVFLCTGTTILLWIELMNLLDVSKIDKRVISAQATNYEQIVYNILTSRPNRMAMINFEKVADKIFSLMSNVDWSKVNTKQAVKFIPPKRTSPKRSSGKRAVSRSSRKSSPVSVSTRTVANPDLILRFRELVDLCVKKYGTKKNVVEECAKVGIPIGRTSFNVACNTNHISIAAKAFIEQAPKKLLGLDGTESVANPAPQETPPPTKVEQASSGAFLNANNYEQVEISNLNDFALNFRSMLLSASSFLNTAVRAGAETRQKLFDQNKDVMEQFEASLQAMKAEDPLKVLQLLAGTGVSHSTKRERGHRRT